MLRSRALLLLAAARAAVGPAVATTPAAGWSQSYAAGYRDQAGKWAGGSEIMHLVGHEGALFAANVRSAARLCLAFAPWSLKAGAMC